MIKWLQQIDVNNFADWMNKMINLLQSKMLYAQVLQEYHVNKKWTPAYDFKSDDKVYLSTQNLKTWWLSKKLDWKFMKWLMIKQKMSIYAYELELSSGMKVHSTFHMSLLWSSKNNSISRQVLSSQPTIIKNKEGPYFVNLIDDMKWNTQSAQFKLLIKWKEYEQRTWESYTMIKKDAPEKLKEFHEDHLSWSVLTEWIKEENKWLPSDTQNMNTQNTWTWRERFWRRLSQNLDIQNFFFECLM